METCLIVQPIHPAGLARLSAAGLEIRQAEATDAPTLGREAADCVAAITRSAGFPASAVAAASRLRVIGVHGTGTDPVAIAEATAAGIAVINTPGANARSVAEHALALAFALAKTIPAADRAVRAGDAGYKYRAAPIELAGQTLGVVGFGAIGRETARLGRAIGMRVLAYGPTRADAEFAAVGAERAPSLDAVLTQSAVLSLHLPLTARTRGLIGRRELAQMKPGALLVNTARGALVDETALADALTCGALAGAGLDVFSGDALPTGHPLLTEPRAILTPHVAGSTEAALIRTAEAVAERVLDVLNERRPDTLVNPEVWPCRRRG